MGIQLLQLKDERKLSAQEIWRLSPCATFYHSLIGIRWDPEEQSGVAFLTFCRLESAPKI